MVDEVDSLVELLRGGIDAVEVLVFMHVQYEDLGAISGCQVGRYVHSSTACS
jgi:hypothetical protein